MSRLKPESTRVRLATLWGAAALLAVTFVFAAVPKIHEPGEFALAIYRYQILPDAWINPAAILLPWIELCAACALLWPRMRSGAALLTLSMLIVFTAAIASSLYRGLNISCGCFSVDPDAGHAGAWNLIRNGLLMIATLGVLTLSKRRVS